MGTVTWPGTRRDNPPADHPYRSATWLLGRHPQLGDLDADGPDIDLDALGEHDAALVDDGSRHK